MSNISKYSEAVWAVSTGVDDYGDMFVKRFRRDIDAPDPSYPFASGFTIALQFAEADGLPSEKDRPILDAFEDSLLAIIEGSDEGRLTWVITSNKHRTFLFYTKSNLEQYMDQIGAVIPEGPDVVLRIEEQPTWDRLMESKALYDQQYPAGKGG